MDKHEAICKLKELASDIGRIPTREQARAHGIGYTLEKLFGGFTLAVQAAGLKKSRQTKKGNAQASISKRLKDHKSTKAVLGPSKRVLILGDTHFPFCHGDSLSLVYALAENLERQLRMSSNGERGIDVIIQMGDLYDMFAHSKFPRSTLGYNAEEEIEIGYKQASEMWATLKRLCPSASLKQLFGNHDIRPLKRIIETYPEGEVFFEFKKWYEFPSVELQEDYRTPMIIDGVFYQHGHSSKLGSHRDHNHANTVVGHTHRGGVAFRKINNETLWELNAGYLGDPESKALSYTQTRVTQWTLGVGWIDELGPRFIPFSETD